MITIQKDRIKEGRNEIKQMTVLEEDTKAAYLSKIVIKSFIL